MQVLLVLGFYHRDKKDKIHRLIHDWFKNGRIVKPSCQEAEAGFIQKIATIFQGLFKDHIRFFQGQPTRNIISQIVQKCIFPVYSNKTLRL